MLKVRETQTQDHLRSEKKSCAHLNLADYLYDLNAIAKETGELDNLKIMYVLNKSALQPHYELHRLHAIECILRVRHIQLLPASPTFVDLPSCMYECFGINDLFCAGKGKAQLGADFKRTGKQSSNGKPSSGAEQSRGLPVPHR